MVPVRCLDVVHPAVVPRRVDVARDGEWRRQKQQQPPARQGAADSDRMLHVRVIVQTFVGAVKRTAARVMAATARCVLGASCEAAAAPGDRPGPLSSTSTGTNPMTIKRLTLPASAVLLIPVLAAAGGAFHLELVDSFPKADAVVHEAPSQIWLQFSVAPDMEQTSFAVRGADGNIELGEITVGESPEVIQAAVAQPLEDGEYTLSWVGAPVDDHPVRGRYTFTVSVATSGR